MREQFHPPKGEGADQDALYISDFDQLERAHALLVAYGIGESTANVLAEMLRACNLTDSKTFSGFMQGGQTSELRADITAALELAINDPRVDELRRKYYQNMLESI